MKWLLYLLAALLAAISAGTVIARDPGRVVFVWGGWTVETSAVFFCAALLGAVIVVHFGLRLLRGLLRLPELLRRWRGDRRALQAEDLLARGLLRILAGDWRLAERDMKRWAARGCNPMLGFLYAARAADSQGAARRRDHYLAQAADASRDPVELVLARSALLPNLAGARTELVQLAADDPVVAASSLARRARLTDALERADWGEARRLVAALQKDGEMDGEESAGFERRIATASLAGARDGDALAAAWKGIARELRREPVLLEQYVRARLRFGAAEDCEPLIAEVLSRDWHAPLVQAYGEVHGAKPDRQLRIAEGWLKRHGADADLLLTLGRLALRAGEEDRGRAWLEECLRARPSAPACRELGRWHDQHGDPAMALSYYRQALSLSS